MSTPSKTKSTKKTNQDSSSSSLKKQRKTKCIITPNKRKKIINDDDTSSNENDTGNEDNDSTIKEHDDSITTMTTMFKSMQKNTYINNSNNNTLQYYFYTKDYNSFKQEYTASNSSYNDSFSIFIPREGQMLKGTITITPLPESLSVVISYAIPKEMNNSIDIDLRIFLFSSQKKLFLLKVKTKMKGMKEINVFEYNEICSNQTMINDSLMEPFIMNINMITQPKTIEKTYEYNGLINEGNTCYMNCILQTLCHLPFIRNRILTMKTDDKVITALKKLFYELLMKKEESEELEDFEREICVKVLPLFNAFEWSKSFWNNQQDAEEIFTSVYSHIDNINKSIKEKDDNKERVLLNEECEGEINTLIKCKEINHDSEQKEVFFFLQLEINQAASLRESLDHFFGMEELTESNQYQHENSKYYDAQKQCSLSKIPNILFMQLKRFEMIDKSQDKHHIKKNCQSLTYPSEIDLSAYLNHKQSQLVNPCLYSLYSIIVHDGSFHHGHYYTYIKDIAKGKWILFNDTKVSYPSMTEIFDENYGGEDFDIQVDPSTNTLRKNVIEKEKTAYLLVYYNKAKTDVLFNETETEEIMANIKEEMEMQKQLKANAIGKKDKKTNSFKLFSQDKEMVIDKEITNSQENNKGKDMNIEEFILSNVSKSRVKQKPEESGDNYSQFTQEIAKNYVRKTKDAYSSSSNDTAPILRSKLHFNKPLPNTNTSPTNNNNNKHHHHHHIIKSNILFSKESNQSKSSRLKQQPIPSTIFTPNKNKLNFNFISNATSTILHSSYLIYNPSAKINGVQILNDCYKNTPEDIKPLITFNSSKLVIMNTLGLIIEISSDKDNIQDLINQYINNAIHLCIYVFDMDLAYEMNNNADILTINLLHKNFTEDNTGCHFSHAGIKYPYVTYVNYNDHDNEKTLDGRMMIGLKHFDIKEEEKVEWKKVTNCASSLKDLNKYTMVKVDKFDLMKRKEVILLSKGMRKEGNGNRLIRLIIER